MRITRLVETRRDVAGFTALAATLTGVIAGCTYAAVAAVSGQVRLVWPLQAISWTAWRIPPAIPIDPASHHLATGFLAITVIVGLAMGFGGGWLAHGVLETIRARHADQDSIGDLERELAQGK